MKARLLRVAVRGRGACAAAALGAMLICSALRVEAAPGDAAELQALLKAHNEERAKEKLLPLAINRKLQASAEEHARDMAQHEKMSHEGNDGAGLLQRIERQGYHFQGAGENVAKGNDSVAELMRAWMESPAHRKNILDDFTEIGIGSAAADDGTVFWCVEFGKPWVPLDQVKAEAEVLARLNKERARFEIRELRPNPKLMTAARDQASELAALEREDVQEVDGPDPFRRVKDTGYRFARIGAVGASGQATPQEVVSKWLDEGEHRETLLGGFRDVGVGFATTPKGVPYWFTIVADPVSRPVSAK